MLLVAALALLVLVRRLGAAWAQRARGPAGFFALALVVAVLPAGTSLVMASASAECSAEKEAKWQEWLDAGGPGSPPYECASY